MTRPPTRNALDHAQVVERAPVGIESRRRRFGRAEPGTLLLTPDELVVLRGPAHASDVMMRQDRHDLAMVRRPTARGGERVELSALDGQQATLRFDPAQTRVAVAL